MVWLSWTDQITTNAFLKSSMTPLNSSPSRKIPLYLEKVDCNISSDNWRKIAILITMWTRATIPKAPNQQEVMVSQNCTRIVDPTLLRHFAPCIVSSIGTYNNYNLAKYPYNLLSPHIPTEHCATDTFIFVQDIQSLSMFGKFMVSLDVESLFTNIPLKECIYLAVNYTSEGNPDLKLSESKLRSLFTVA